MARGGHPCREAAAFRSGKWTYRTGPDTVSRMEELLWVGVGVLTLGVAGLGYAYLTVKSEARAWERWRMEAEQWPGPPPEPAPPDNTLETILRVQGESIEKALRAANEPGPALFRPEGDDEPASWTAEDAAAFDAGPMEMHVPWADPAEQDPILPPFEGPAPPPPPGMDEW